MNIFAGSNVALDNFASASDWFTRHLEGSEGLGLMLKPFSCPCGERYLSPKHPIAAILAFNSLPDHHLLLTVTSCQPRPMGFTHCHTCT